MKRDKTFWSRLTKEERSTLVALEKAANKIASRCSYLPDDCVECTCCGNPTIGLNLCEYCYKDLKFLLNKANGKQTGTTV